LFLSLPLGLADIDFFCYAELRFRIFFLYLNLSCVRFVMLNLFQHLFLLAPIFPFSLLHLLFSFLYLPFLSFIFPSSPLSSLPLLYLPFLSFLFISSPSFLSLLLPLYLLSFPFISSSFLSFSFPLFPLPLSSEIPKQIRDDNKVWFWRTMDNVRDVNKGGSRQGGVRDSSRWMTSKAIQGNNRGDGG